MTLLVLAFVAVTSGKDGRAQGSPPVAKPDAPPASAPARAAPRSTGSFVDNVGRGFFGDLSAPPPPAVNLIQGVRLPDAEPAKPAAAAGKPTAPPGDAPASRGTPAPTVPPADPVQTPTPSAPAQASPAAERNAAQEAPAASSAR